MELLFYIGNIALLTLLVLYFFIRRNVNKIDFFEVDTLGEKKRKSSTTNLQKQIIHEDMIRFKKYSFYAYFISAIICFILGITLIVKLFFFDLKVDINLLIYIFSIAGGVSLTITLRNIYIRCKTDVDVISNS